MKSSMQIMFTLVTTSLLLAVRVIAQDKQEASDTLRRLAPKIYIDCKACWQDDLDYFRTELTFVNFVRDRKQADVHIIITTQATGSGGIEVTIEFIGQGKYKQMVDTLKFFTKESDTDDMTRRAAVRTLKMGLMRYVAKTPLAEHVAIDYTKPSEPMAVADKWNYWVFEIDAGGWLDGEKSIRNLNVWGGVEARRVTQESKVKLDYSGSYRDKKIEYEDEDGNHQEVLTIWRSKEFRASFIKSLGPHWSIGIAGSAWSSTFQNTKINVVEANGLEYNLFPYELSTQRELRFEYWGGINYVDYEDITLYDKASEWLASEKLSVTLKLIRPWGTVETSLAGAHYFHDFRRNRLELSNDLSLRLFEGFSLNVSGWISYLHDQLYLPKEGLTEEEALSERRARETNYDYWVNFSISYTFGSIYNNIVNPRFGD
jgi:hypothetical protein